MECGSYAECISYVTALIEDVVSHKICSGLVGSSGHSNSQAFVLQKASTGHQAAAVSAALVEFWGVLHNHETLVVAF